MNDFGLPNLNDFQIPKISMPKIKSLKIKPIKVKNIYAKKVGEGGKEFEKRVKGDLIKKGYEVHGAHNQHYDLYARKKGKEYFIECKCTTARLSPKEEDFMAKSIKNGKNYWVARKTKTNRIEYKKY